MNILCHAKALVNFSSLLYFAVYYKELNSCSSADNGHSWSCV